MPGLLTGIEIEQHLRTRFVISSIADKLLINKQRFRPPLPSYQDSCDLKQTEKGAENTGMEGPLIITGMRYSAARAVTGVFSSLGVNLVESSDSHVDSVPRSDRDNTGILRLQEEMLSVSSRPRQNSYSREKDYPRRSIGPGCLSGMFSSRSTKMLDALEQGGIGGWYDPHSALLLDFWATASRGAAAPSTSRVPWDHGRSTTQNVP